ncbi:MAG: hypothetical protein ACRD0J_16520, partial [Acidimicrobiales bacterium]
DEEGGQMAERIDRRVDRLPGLEGLHLLGGAVRVGLAGEPERTGNPWVGWKRPFSGSSRSEQIPA